MNNYYKSRLIKHLQSYDSDKEVCESVDGDCHSCPFPELYPALVNREAFYGPLGIRCQVKNYKKPITKDKLNISSAQELVYEFLNKNRGNKYCAKEIAKGIGLSDNSVREIANRLFKQKKICRETFSKEFQLQKYHRYFIDDDKGN